jgi:hypothetical protein
MRGLIEPNALRARSSPSPVLTIPACGLCQSPLQNAGYDLTVFFATMNGVEHEKDLWASHRKLVVPMDIRKEVGKAVGAARVKIQVTLDGKRDLALPKDFCERWLALTTPFSPTTRGCWNLFLVRRTSQAQYRYSTASRAYCRVRLVGRASRDGGVSDLPPEIPHVTIRNFCIAALTER